MAKKRSIKTFDDQILDFEKKKQEALDKAASFDEKIKELRGKQLELFCKELIPKLEEKNYNITKETIDELLNSLDISAYAAEKGITLTKEMVDEYLDLSKNKSKDNSANISKTEESKNEVKEKNEKNHAPEDEQNDIKTENVKEEVMSRFGSKNIPGMPEV